jgi:hypothetical protein
MKLERVYEISLKFPPPNTITTHFHSFKPITRFSFYFLFFSFPPRLIILLFLKKLVKTSIQHSIENYVRAKKRAPQDPSPPFKEKEKGVKVDLKLGGQWNVPSLVANGRRRRNFLCLEANGRRRRSFLAWWPMECEGKTLFTSSHLPPNKLT